ncbi:MAG: hypothetical protein P8Z80_04655 [Pseudolabrys sp.]
MWQMAIHSIVLFAQGKLFSEPAKVYRQTFVGAAVAAAVLVILAKIGVSLVLAAVVAGILGGALQPYLFKDLRYR